ncbi:HEAT repeat domain-containing protein [Candidatus Uabimicrobium sp. HlEnr_7]|uniref:HEAT repeat domain-containing protein n=1 Tax=Candidatus Uabimicrobium helgolandensis TaxID=3095367 RepID=UPI00355879A5
MNFTKKAILSIKRFYQNLAIAIPNFVMGMINSLFYFWKSHLLIGGIFSVLLYLSHFDPFLGLILTSLFLIVLATYNIQLLNKHSSLSRLLSNTIDSTKRKELQDQGIFGFKQNWFSYHSVWVNIIFILTASLVFRGIALSFSGWYSYSNTPDMTSWIVFALDDILLKGVLTFDVMEKFHLNIVNIHDVGHGAKALSIFFRIIVGLFFIKIIANELMFYFTVSNHITAMKNIHSYKERTNNKSYCLLQQLGKLPVPSLIKGLHSKHTGTRIGCASLLVFPQSHKYLVAFIRRNPDAESLASALISLANSKYSRLEELIHSSIPHLHAELIDYVFMTIANSPHYLEPKNFSSFSKLTDTVPEKALPALYCYLAAIHSEEKDSFFRSQLDPTNPQLFGCVALALANVKNAEFIPQYFLAAVISTESVAEKIINRLGNFDIKNESLELVQHLRNPLPEARQEACEQLVNDYPAFMEKLFPYLLLNDPEQDVRRSILEGIGSHEMISCAPSLQQALRTGKNSEETRALIITTISDMELKEYGEDLLHTLNKDDSAWVRSSVIYTMVSLELKEYGENIAKALIEDPDETVREAAAEAIGDLGLKQYGASLLRALQEDKKETPRENAVRAIAKLGLKEYSNELLNLFKSKEDLRCAAIEAIGKLGSPQHIEKIVSVMLHDSMSFARCSAITALIMLDKDHSALEQALNDTDESVRDRAIRAITEIEATQYSESLVKLSTSDQDQYVRESAIKAIGELNLTNYTDQVATALLKDQAADVRSAAVTVLKTFGQDHPALEQALSDADEFVRMEAIEAITEIQATHYSQSLIKLANDENESVRTAVLVAIDTLDLRQYISIVRNAVNDLDEYVREEATTILEKWEPNK